MPKEPPPVVAWRQREGKRGPGEVFDENGGMGTCYRSACSILLSIRRQKEHGTPWRQHETAQLAGPGVS
jgi:hypothetical protein